jgi:hypothetical protein
MLAEREGRKQVDKVLRRPPERTMSDGSHQLTLIACPQLGITCYIEKLSPWCMVMEIQNTHSIAQSQQPQELS